MSKPLAAYVTQASEDLKHVAQVLTCIATIDEDDEFDADYFVENVVKFTKKLKTLSEKYESTKDYIPPKSSRR